MNIIKGILSFFKSLFKESIKSQLDVVVPLAKKAVQMIEADPSIIVDGNKRDTAVSLIIKELIDQELKVVPRILNLAIEIAVVDLKGDQ